mmetsp:Transcript_4586/g.6967  ORF Transcript_4586/g.6967 Transcript_4586/m.6967 type:complete len:92 (+) Transcript_4586:1307-1582(+)
MATKKGATFKWTEESEDLLEEILIGRQFDFEQTATDFANLVNKDVEEPYEITTKTIQVRWTDIEIRKYRLNDAAGGYTEIPSQTDDQRDLS